MPAPCQRAGASLFRFDATTWPLAAGVALRMVRYEVEGMRAALLGTTISDTSYR